MRQPITSSVGRREVVDQPADVARIVADLLDQRRQPEHGEQAAGPGQGPDERPAVVAAPAAHEHDGDGEQAQPTGHQQVRDVGLGGERRGHDERDRASCGRRTRTDQAASRTTIQAISGRYGFHGWISTIEPVAAQQHGDHQRRRPARRPVAARRWPIHSATAIQAVWIIDRRGLHRPRRTPEQPVAGRDEPEADRAGVAALLGERADPAREPDQRRVPAADVAHPELGHRQVEHREPAPAREGDHGDDQRQRDGDRDDDDRRPPDATGCRRPAPAAGSTRSTAVSRPESVDRSSPAEAAAQPAPSVEHAPRRSRAASIRR